MKMIPIKSAYLHTPTFGPKINEATITQEKLPGVKIYWDTDSYSLLIHFKDVKVRTPLSNVKSAVDMDEQPVEEKKK